MTDAQYNLFLSVASWFCAVGTIANLAMIKKRGASAIVLASAFLVFAGVLWLLKTHAGQASVAGGVVLLLLLLAVDFILRARRQDQSR